MMVQVFIMIHHTQVGHETHPHICGMHLPHTQQMGKHMIGMNPQKVGM